jgi:hypothetical protein
MRHVARPSRLRAAPWDASCEAAGRAALDSGRRGLRLPVRPLPRPDKLRPVEFRPVELFLDALERGVPDRAVGPEGHEPPPLGIGRGPHDRRVGIPTAGARGGRRCGRRVLRASG